MSHLSFFLVPCLTPPSLLRSLFLLKLGCHLLLLQQSYEKVHAFELKQHQTCPVSAEVSLTSLARSSHRRTRSQFDLPLRRDRLDTLLSSETSTSEAPFAGPAPSKLSDSENEHKGDGDYGSSSGTLFDEASSDGGEATPLALVKRSRSLTAVPDPIEACLCTSGPQEGECGLRCRVRVGSGVTGGPETAGGVEPREDARGSALGAEGGHIPLANVDRYSMVSSQIV